MEIDMDLKWCIQFRFLRVRRGGLMSCRKYRHVRRPWLEYAGYSLYDQCQVCEMEVPQVSIDTAKCF